MFRELLKLFSPDGGLPIDERRDTIRLECSIAATMKHGSLTREVRVLNASLTGLKVELESKIKKKTKVSVHRDKFGGPVVGTVVWCRAQRGSSRFQVGIAYQDDKEMLKSSWLKPALKELGFTVGRINEKRQLTRVPGRHRRCFLKSLTGGDTYSAGKLLNLSTGGALVESEVELPKGFRLRLKSDPVANLPDLVMDAEVKSCKRNPSTRKWEVGLKFFAGDIKLVKKYMSIMMQDP